MERILTVLEAADYLRQSVYTVRNWIKSGKLQATRVGKKYLIPEVAVQTLVIPQVEVSKSQSQLSVKDALGRMHELQAESKRAGIGGTLTYRKAMAQLDKRESESMAELGSRLNGNRS